MKAGVAENEIQAFNIMHGSGCTPELLRILKDNAGITIGYTVEKIEGKHLSQYLDNADKKAKFLLSMRKVIESFHSNGLLMPHDHGKNENWIVDEDGNPFMVDLGEVYHVRDERNGSRTMLTDLVSFSDLYERYKSRIRPFKERREKRRIETIIYRDLFVNADLYR